jgi:hypothetical protein
VDSDVPEIVDSAVLTAAAGGEGTVVVVAVG